VASGDDAEDVVFADERELLLVELDLGPAVLADEDAVADLHLEGDDLASLVALAGAKGDDLGLLGLLFGAIRDDDASADLLFVLEMLHEDAITDRSDFNFSHMMCVLGWKVGTGRQGRPGSGNFLFLLLGLLFVHDLEVGVDDVGLLLGLGLGSGTAL